MSTSSRSRARVAMPTRLVQGRSIAKHLPETRLVRGTNNTDHCAREGTTRMKPCIFPQKQPALFSALSLTLLCCGRGEGVYTTPPGGKEGLMRSWRQPRAQPPNLAPNRGPIPPIPPDFLAPFSGHAGHSNKSHGCKIHQNQKKQIAVWSRTDATRHSSMHDPALVPLPPAYKHVMLVRKPTARRGHRAVTRPCSRPLVARAFQ